MITGTMVGKRIKNDAASDLSPRYPAYLGHAAMPQGTALDGPVSGWSGLARKVMFSPMPVEESRMRLQGRPRWDDGFAIWTQ